MEDLRLDEAALLGLVQGVTEWLPVSSSGHLALVQIFLELKPPLFFDVMLHFGTLLVVLAFFRHDIAEFFREEKRREGAGGYLLKVFAALMPTAVIGVVFGDIFESFFSNAVAVAVALLFTGAILYASERVSEGNRKIGFTQAFVIGIAQGIAIIPGVSRSGFTIAAGLLLGVKREETFKFSFAIFVPAVLGALAKTFLEEAGQIGLNGVGWLEVAVGTTVAAVVGYFSIKLLAQILAKRRFHVFAYYCWAVGASLLLWLAVS